MMIQTQIIKWKVQTMILPNFFLLDKFPFSPGPMPAPAWWENEDEGLDDD